MKKLIQMIFARLLTLCLCVFASNIFVPTHAHADTDAPEICDDTGEDCSSGGGDTSISCAPGQFLSGNECEECPAYSTSELGASVCTCETDFSIDGTAEGDKTVTDGTCNLIPEFKVITTDMPENTTFWFGITAAGTFYVDCGEGGTPVNRDGTPVDTISVNGNIGTINIESPQSDGKYNIYGCKYTDAGEHTIRFAGDATKYSTTLVQGTYDNNTYYPSYYMPALAFNAVDNNNMLNTYVQKIDGSLGKIFATLDDGTQPSFAFSFWNQPNLTGTIPEKLFDGIYGKPIKGMFAGTFQSCPNLSGTIPVELFRGISSSAEHLFAATFHGCSRLSGTIPGELFSGINSGAESMFAATFMNCSSLSEIPANLFQNVSGGADRMFYQTFTGCSSLSGEIPANLFQNVSGGADRMFRGTFSECSDITSVPAGLFAGIEQPAEEMFALTFMNCSSLSEIPANLFENVSGGAAGMFWSTFDGCSSLSEIPENLFKNINTPAYRMFRATFNNCSNITSVPVGLFAKITQPAEEIFARTFQKTGLTKIPYGLFAKLTDEKPETNMFYQTFNGCTNMAGWLPENSDLIADQGWVPYDMFGGISPDGYVAGTAMTDVFKDTAIATSCPANWYEKDIAFDVDWSNKVSCEQCPDSGISVNPTNKSVENCYKIEECSTTGGNGTKRCYYNTESKAYDECEDDEECVITNCKTGYEQKDGSQDCSPITYNITYDSNGGTTVENTTYTVEDTVDLLTTTPTRDGYTFAGWYDKENLDGDEVTQIELGSTSDRTFLAKWKDCQENHYCPGDNKEYSCPAFSSSKPGASVCTCETDFSIDGTAEGDKTVTDGTCELIPEFTVETTNMAKNTTFVFGITAAGKFYVDCGEGGTPVYMSSVNGNIGTINIAKPRSDGKYNRYECKYTDAGKHTIRFAGDATKYSTHLSRGTWDGNTYYPSHYTSALGFNLGKNNIMLNTYVRKIDGSLGKIFATLDDGTQPSFAYSFWNQQNLTGTIPSKLFDGIYGEPITGMFAATFKGCLNLSDTIPRDLFRDISGSAEHLFGMTFYGCSGLSGTIPGELFRGINGGANSMFAMTFMNCSDLTGIGDGLFDEIETAAERMFLATFASNSKLESIPDGLFQKVSGSATEMFTSTFQGCSSLSGIPKNLFQNVSGSATEMFRTTFALCSNLKSIPDGLFQNVSGSATEMFTATFSGCSSLSGEIPENLFQNVSGGAAGMFWSTFTGCSSLSGIPENLFKNIDTPADKMFRATFSDSPGITSIPAGLFAGIRRPAKEMFALTFRNASGLTEIPYGLFANLDKEKPEEKMFDQTFSGCTNMKGWLPENSDLNTDQGWVPYDMFGGISPDGYEKDYAMKDVFNGTAIAESCPANWYKKYIEFEVDWSNKVSCEQCPSTHPNSGAGATNINECYTSCEVSCKVDDTICPDNATCTYITDAKETGTEYYNGTCDVKLQPCDVESFTCNDGYKKNDTGDACVAIEYNVTYNCNGGSGTGSDTAIYDEPFTPHTNICTRSGYEFIGWKIDNADATNPFTWKYTSDKEMVAVWNQVSTECAPGEYLPAHATQCKQCERNHYCPGGTYEITDTDSGIEKCTTFATSEPGAVACECGEDFSIDGKADGDKTVTDGTCNLIPEFTVKTINMPANTTFWFGITAAGKFYVDCGEGGTPVYADNINGNIGTINLATPFNNGQVGICGCKYTDTREHTIHFAGDATKYQRDFSNNNITGEYDDETLGNKPSYYSPSITFNPHTSYNGSPNIKEISGSLGKIFGTLDDGTQPSFAYTFRGASNMTGTIPSELFNGVQGTPIIGMFAGTFNNCSKLSGTIPEDLFSGISGNAEYLFGMTFDGCSKLSGTIPGELFSGINGGAPYMFANTFNNCSSLSEIPENLFQNVSGGADGMFWSTFTDCSSLSGKIPENLFKNIDTPAYRMFRATFSGCPNITSVPAGLFTKITQPAEEMFARTFRNTGLTEIPYGLFANLAGTKPEPNMFYQTFKGCTNMEGWLPNDVTLTPENQLGWIPVSMFDDMDDSEYSTGYAMKEIFLGADKLATSCPENWYNADIAFAVDWDGHVSCAQCPDTHPNSGAGATSINECYTSCEAACNEPSYCPVANATCVYTQSKNTDTEYYNGTCEAESQTCDVESFTCNDGYKKNDTGDACVAIEYTITYDANGGNGTMADITCTYDNPCELTENAFTLNGYVFSGWNTSANGSGTAYDDKAKIENITGTITLYAQWKQCDEGKYCPGDNKEYACPAFSSSKPGASVCTCEKDFSIDGKADGDKTVTVGTCKLIPEFTVETTNMPANTTFWVGITAAGTFYVDCGDYGTPVYTDTINGNIGTINLAEPLNKGRYGAFGCKYTKAGEYKIHFAGDATKYSTHLFQARYDGGTYYPSYHMSAFGFNIAGNFLNTYVRKIDGSLGHIFGTIDDGEDASQQPSFANSFVGQKDLTGPIPEKLFDGIYGKPITGMFAATFHSCPKLSGTIPGDLFSGISGSAEYLFGLTFYGCSSLSEIPEKLFENVSGGADYMFWATFDGCSRLSKIPENLFAGVSGSANGMFKSTFDSCTSLTSIPENLFAGVSGSASDMFRSTFNNCTSLTSLPDGLFQNISGGADGMFWSTFDGCSSLSEIPENLFKNINTPAYRMFRATFWGCSNITSVPAGLFAKITQPAEEMFALTFQNTGLTEIPYGLFANLDKEKPEPNMFDQTFSGCTNMKGWLPENSDLNTDQGWVPYDMFGGISPVDYVAGTAMTDVFKDTAIAESCPANWYKKDIAFDVDWSNKVSCAQCPDSGISVNPTNKSVENCYKIEECSTTGGNGTKRCYYNTESKAYDECEDDEECVITNCKTGYEQKDGSQDCSPITYNITYDSNGGTTVENTTYTVEDTVPLPEPTRDGYTFAGWYDKENLDGDEVTQIELGSTSDRTFLAKWEDCQENHYCPGDNKEYACPAFSSSEPGASVCTCEKDFSIDGTANGDQTVTDGTCELIPEFTVETTNMATNTKFHFGLSAAGTFYVDCGEGGVLSGSGVTRHGSIGKIVIKTPLQNGTFNQYECTYTKSGKHIIGFAGDATAYTNHYINATYENNMYFGPYYTGVLTFYNDMFVYEISGSLGAIFGTLADGSQPSFNGLFNDQRNLQGNIPEDLFTGIKGTPIDGMFASLFEDCKSLNGPIPEKLFAGISGQPAAGMFFNTFAGCSNLEGTIPPNLFAGLEGNATPYLFSWTFAECDKLSGTISPNLFAKIKGEPAEFMFNGTFYFCPNLTGEIHEDLFRNISGAPQPYMYSMTFLGCDGLTGKLSDKLFAGINGAPAQAMYQGTFAYCPGLSGKIPEKMFGKIKGNVAADMYYGVFLGDSNLTGRIPATLFGELSGTPRVDSFASAFDGCSGLTGFVPPELFAGIDNKNYQSGPMSDIFLNSGIIEQCPEDMYQFFTGFESDWDGHVSCAQCPDTHPKSGAGATSINECYTSCEVSCKVDDTICPDNATCTYITDTKKTGNENFGGTCNVDAEKCEIQEINCNNGYTLNGNQCVAIEYNVTYNCNDGIGTGSDTAIYDQTFTPRTNICTRSGYKFSGWTIDNTDATNPFTWKYTSDKEMVAVWNQASTECAPGEYLPAHAANCVPCKENHYCLGGAYEITDTDSGIEECTTFATSEPGAVACKCGEDFSIDGKADGDQTVTDGTCELIPEFTVETTNMATNAKFHFGLSAAGTFYVDCGESGVLSGSGVTRHGSIGKIVIKTPLQGNAINLYTCTYTTTGKHIIGFAGDATEYSKFVEYGHMSHGTTPAIAFHTNNNPNLYIYKIYGSLGHIFGTIDDGDTLSKQPSFNNLFREAQNFVGPIPEELFDGIHGKPVSHMFSSAFNGCRNLTGPIPEKLFNVVSGTSEGLFSWTFGNCTSLNSSIPTDLFKTIRGEPQLDIYYSTFYNCPKLTGEIPPELFSGLNGAPAPYMFGWTFANDTGLTGQYSDLLFAGIDGAPAQRMYEGTFAYCKNITSSISKDFFGKINGNAAQNMFASTFFNSGISGNIPEGLFADITGEPQPDMFNGLFYNCDNLTGKIPGNLFQNIKGTPVNRSFVHMFEECSGLTGFVPPELFAGIDNKNYQSGPMSDIFLNSGIIEQCPEDMYQFFTGFESDWDNRVSCLPCPYGLHSPAGSTSIDQCVADAIECGADFSTMGHQYWDSKNGWYSKCIIEECIDGYHVELNACMPDEQSCAVTNGTGIKTWDYDTKTYGPCVAQRCTPGYTTDASLSDQPISGCSRCANMYVNGEIAVSGYVDECEIASCMYQGEKYILENNECVPICEEETDETGHRYWNGKECVHDCNAGYIQW